MSNHKTKGIVLKTVKYGETSIIASIYTEAFGIQSYLINGVRVSSKKGHGKASLFQPAAILDLVVYHSDMKNLQRIREFKWAHLYDNLFSNVFKNSVGLFMIELLYKSLKQPESNQPLFDFIEDAFMHLDKASQAEVANFPLYFAVHLCGFYGFKIDNSHSTANPILDLREGQFIAERPEHLFYLDGDESTVTSTLLKVMQPHELSQIKLNQETRRRLLHAYETFYGLHIQDFGKMKTLPVLEAVLS